MSGFRPLAELSVDADRGTVYEHGWQSWSPATVHPPAGAGHRPARPAMQTMCYRPGRPAPPHGFQGEGLLAVDPGTGDPVRVYAARHPGGEQPSIRAELVGDRMVVAGERPEAVEDLPVAGSLPAALAAWADRLAVRAAVAAPRRAPTVWCSWYHYLHDATEADVLENLDAIGTRELPVEVVQVDDGWQAEIGDWLTFSDSFASLGDLAGRIRDAGRRAGLWSAPFLVGARSRLAREHPDWLVAGASAGHNWGQDLFALDVTHPGAVDYLRRVFQSLRGLGFDYFKLDFAYAGALEGRRRRDLPAVAAYREGLALIREAVGPDAYLLGCGAPILPSVGLLDAMRVGPDIDRCFEPPDGDQSRPSQRAATLSVVGRAWQHGRFWVNDPDCLLLAPGVQRRGLWARTVERYGGLRGSSDRIGDLDRWGLATTRRLLAQAPPPVPFAPTPELAVTAWAAPAGGPPSRAT
jgi:alpha-galactosidase